ncbi:hypothetical protein [Massilia aerilata]|uniref:Uncharacterized protein n=1 Tax=Massilia aerilata TaxID=453817 RepID=A0ABW0RTV1_9BURK
MTDKTQATGTDLALEELAERLRSAARQLRQYLKLATGTADWSDSQQSSACDEAAKVVEQIVARRATTQPAALAAQVAQVLPPWPEPVSPVDHEKATVAPWLTDKQIVDALHSLGIDTEMSKYGFPEIQVRGTNVPNIRRLVAKLAPQPVAVDEQAHAGDVELIRVPAHEADSYCRILTILGMEEEGNPVAEVQRLFDADEARATQRDVLDPVEGDKLPPVGSKVLIHLARQDAWVEHTVTGYYAWGDLGGNPHLHRVFVRVKDADGYDNARLLSDARPAAAIGDKDDKNA